MKLEWCVRWSWTATSAHVAAPEAVFYPASCRLHRMLSRFAHNSACRNGDRDAVPEDTQAALRNWRRFYHANGCVESRWPIRALGASVRLSLVEGPNTGGFENRVKTPSRHATSSFVVQRGGSLNLSFLRGAHDEAKFASAQGERVFRQSVLFDARRLSGRATGACLPDDGATV